MPVTEDVLDARFAALADPTRRAILTRLASGDLSVNALAEPFGLSLQAVSKHIKVLERCGLITRGRQAQTRPCRLDPVALSTTVEWVEEQQRLWHERFDRFESHLMTLQGQDGNEAPPAPPPAPEPEPEPPRGPRP